jgi:hypothetical protein
MLNNWKWSHTVVVALGAAIVLLTWLVSNGTVSPSVAAIITTVVTILKVFVGLFSPPASVPAAPEIRYVAIPQDPPKISVIPVVPGELPKVG